MINNQDIEQTGTINNTTTTKPAKPFLERGHDINKGILIAFGASDIIKEVSRSSI